MPPGSSSFVLRHVAVVLGLAVLGLVAEASGLDRALAVAVFDPVRGVFPARDWAWLELVGHRLAKSAVWLAWFALLATAVASHRLPALAPRRRALWAATGAMALGPALVAGLKMVTGPRCPWDLEAFGGHAQAATAWLVGTADAGRCFPSGHASGGFSLVALYFAGLALGDARLRRIGLWLGLGVGAAFGAIRMVQGAHFLSHNLWAAAVCWAAAAGVFALALPASADGRHAVAPVPAR
jgi:membrane-associated PAP2 superfamily phosphatase